MADISKIRLSGVTYNIVDDSAVHSLADYSTTEQMNSAITAATTALAEAIAEEGYQNATQVSDAIDAAISGKADTTAVTQSIESAVSGKADTTAVTQSIEAAVSGKADTTAVTEALAAKYGAVEYDSNSKRINFYADSTTGTVLSYVDATDFIKDGMVDNVEITTKWAGWTEVEDFTKFNTTNSVRVYFNPNDLYAGFGVEINPKSITEYPCANNVIQYDSQNEVWTQTLTKRGEEPYRIEYYSGETSNDNYVEITNRSFSDPTYACIIEGVDVSFCIDSVWPNGGPEPQKVEYMDYTTVPVLRITFNSDAGKEQIDIPLTDIFNPNNYYDKTATDAQIAAAVSGKVDTSTFESQLSKKQNTLSAGTGIEIDANNTISVTGVPLTVDDTVTSGSSNPVKSSGIYNAITAATATKQDTLVSGTNIKTVGTESILGSGNIQTLKAEVGTGNDSTTLILTYS